MYNPSKNSEKMLNAARATAPHRQKM